MKNRTVSAPIYALLTLFALWLLVYSIGPEKVSGVVLYEAQSVPGNKVNYVLLEPSNLTSESETIKPSKATQNQVVYKQLEPVYIDSQKFRVTKVDATKIISDLIQFLLVITFLILLIYAGYRLVICSIKNSVEMRSEKQGESK